MRPRNFIVIQAVIFRDLFLCQGCAGPMRNAKEAENGIPVPPSCLLIEGKMYTYYLGKDSKHTRQYIPTSGYNPIFPRLALTFPLGYLLTSKAWFSWMGSTLRYYDA